MTQAGLSPLQTAATVPGSAAVAFESQSRTNPAPTRLILGLSGASGMPFALRMLEVLQGLSVEMHLIVSKAAAQTLAVEMAFNRHATLLIRSMRMGILAQPSLQGRFEHRG